jgi:tetraacyldisaccharide-1-P 4'-kinase
MLLLKAQGAPLMTTEKDAVRLVGQSGALGKLKELTEVLAVKLTPESDLAALILERLQHLPLTVPPEQD